MSVTRIKVNIKNIEWAFKTTDVSDEKKQQVLEDSKWLNKDQKNFLNPTLNQLENFAKHFHVPFGFLLLKKIPEQQSIKLAFRTKENVPAKVGLNVRSVIYEMQRKQAWFKEESGYIESKLNFIGSLSGCNDINKVVETLNTLIELHHFKTPRELLNDLRRQIAFSGVLVMQKGGAGLGTNRPLKVEEVRAFTLLDDHAPLIFLNQKDSYTARIFSLVHEFIHILRGTDEFLMGINYDIEEERFINNATGKFFMPDEMFKKKVNEQGIEAAANYFNVPRYAAAIQAKNLNLIKYLDENYCLEDQKSIRSNNSGGNPYNKALSYNDERFTAALFDSERNGNLQPTEAASLLGVSTKMFYQTMDLFDEREAIL